LKETDFVLFVNISEENFRIHASAVSCVRQKSDKNPIAGTLLFNAFHGNPTINTLNETISTIIHEVFHAMFMAKSLYKYFPDNKNGESSIYQNKKGIYFIRSDNFMKYAREYFNCKFILFLLIKGPFVNQIPLENDGRINNKAGHFEKILFGNELMTSETPRVSVLSAFSLNLALDSGFFKVDISQAEQFFWGRNAGCNFLEYFCDGNCFNFF
jgi:hypothetical protein